MIKSLSSFLLLFGIVLCASFALHVGLETDFFFAPISELIGYSYKFNFGITFLFTITIIVLSKKFHDQLGYIFLVGSALKLAIFILLSKLKDFEIDKNVFFDFFIPYLICLALEIYVVAKLLNSIDESDNQ